MIYITKITIHKYNTSVVWDKIRNWGLKRKTKSRNKQGEKTTRRRKHNIYHKEKKDMAIHANIFTQAQTYTILLSTENNNSYLERNNAPRVCVWWDNSTTGEETMWWYVLSGQSTTNCQKISHCWSGNKNSYKENS